MLTRPHIIMTIDELAEYLRISKSTLYKLAQEGKLPGQKVGRHWRFHREAVDAWLKNQKQNGCPTNQEPYLLIAPDEIAQELRARYWNR